MTRDQSWQERGACYRRDLLDVFFPKDPRDWPRAKLICAACPVRQQCLDLAMNSPTPLTDGVFGGLDPGERRRLRKTMTFRRADIFTRSQRTTPRKAEP